MQLIPALVWFYELELPVVLNTGKEQVEEWGWQGIISPKAFLITYNKHVKSRSNEKWTKLQTEVLWNTSCLSSMIHFLPPLFAVDSEASSAVRAKTVKKFKKLYLFNKGHSDMALLNICLWRYVREGAEPQRTNWLQIYAHIPHVLSKI